LLRGSGLPARKACESAAMQALGFGLEHTYDSSGDFVQSETALTAPVHPHAKLLLSHWREKGCGLIVGRDLPSRPLARVLPNLSLWDYCGERKEFRARLAGFALTRRFGRDISTCRLSDIMAPDEYARHHAWMMRVLDTGEPCSLEIRIKSRRRSAFHLEALFLKVLAADLATPLILFALFYDEGWWHPA
jgi:hypothetical protein